MSRASPWPRSGDAAKAVMVGIIGMVMVILPCAGFFIDCLIRSSNCSLTRRSRWVERPDRHTLSAGGSCLAAHRRLDRGDVDLAHLHHGLERALGHITASGNGLGQDARRDLPRQAPLVLAPAAPAFRATVADDRVPIAVGLRLVVGGDLKGESLALLERFAAVEANAPHAADRELDRQHVARLAAAKV